MIVVFLVFGLTFDCLQVTWIIY